MERPLRPPEMARMLRISERHLYNYIRFMKKFGAPIYFNRSIGRYAYKESGTFFVGFLKDESDTGYDY
ncbi:MAG: hypothetical protein JXB19_11705 [Bacteroidales bacterium]|nr:hypothetical protein [Bacteroidales bacterium]